jgi:hypothetical protein
MVGAHDPERSGPTNGRAAVGLAYMTGKFRACAAITAPLAACGLLVSGCVSSPTYGTDKTSTEQLTTDLTGMFSLKPKGGRFSEYKPRPELVKPTTPTTDLPPPQENIVTASAEVWPESPEEKRARIRANATENRDNPGFEPEVINDISGAASSSSTKANDRAADSGVGRGNGPKADTKKAKQQLAASTQGNPTVRRTLTEPPLEYRLPAETAPVDELGEDEYTKERRLKAAAKRKGDKSWRDLVPWL